MHPNIEQILATIEVLIDPILYVDIPNHEAGSKLNSYAWDTSLYGYFTPFRLLVVEGWLVPTEIEAALSDWKQSEETGGVSAEIVRRILTVDEGDDLFLDDATKAARLQIYQELVDYLTDNLRSLKAYTFSYNQDYSLSAIAGKLPDNRWICFSPTVPQETGKYPVEGMRCVPISTYEAIDPAYSDVEIQIRQIFEKLSPIQTYGWYLSHYVNIHDYRLIYANGHTLESALENCLMQAGLIEVYKFEQFLPRIHGCGYRDRDSRGTKERFERLNSFMKATFADLRMYRFCFWDWEHLYFFDAQQEDDKAGIVIRSQFTYNP